MTPERQDIYTVLIVCYGFYVDDSTVVFALGLALVEYLGSNIDGITDEHRVQVLDALIVQVGNGLSTDIRDGDSYCEGKHQCSHDKDLSVLVVTGIVCVGVNRMVVHRHQTKEVVITLEDGFGEGMLNLRTHF